MATSRDIPTWASSPPHKIFSRMWQGSNKTCVFMPFFGEYGIFILHHMKYVNYFRAPKKIVCCRRGEEAYFPSASHFYYDWFDFVPDEEKLITFVYYNERLDEQYRQLKHHLQVEFSSNTDIIDSNIGVRDIIPCKDSHLLRLDLKPLNYQGASADVVIGARRRGIYEDRNYPHWQYVIDRLSAAGYTVGCVGKQGLSDETIRGSIFSWNFPNPYDAVLEMLCGAKLYIGTDTGVTHTAAHCHVPMIVFRYNDGSPDMLDCAIKCNRSYVTRLDQGWKDPQLVTEQALRYLNDGGSVMKAHNPVPPFFSESSFKFPQKIRF